jgi:hypothetical protein
MRSSLGVLEGVGVGLVQRAWRPVLAAIFVLSIVWPAAAQDWAVKMFNKTSHNFGVVARGASAEWHFVIENSYEEDVHIKSVSSSCKCSKPKLTKALLKTWEKGEIIVSLDTRADFGRKDGTIEVEFDQPFDAKVQLRVHSFIRGDVVVQPGAVQFGSVNQGVEVVRELKVAYAPGRQDWQIRRVESNNPNIEAKADETARTATEVDYKLTVKLRAGAPPGYIQEPLILVTNDVDASKARIPVNIEGLVASALTVRPAWLLMGVAEVGRPVSSNLVIQGRAPFRILSIRADDPRFTGRLPAAAKPFHIIPITFLANDPKSAPGKVNTKIHIETDLPGAGPVEVNASADVVTGEGG